MRSNKASKAEQKTKRLRPLEVETPQVNLALKVEKFRKIRNTQILENGEFEEVMREAVPPESK